MYLSAYSSITDPHFCQLCQPLHWTLILTCLTETHGNSRSFWVFKLCVCKRFDSPPNTKPCRTPEMWTHLRKLVPDKRERDTCGRQRGVKNIWVVFSASFLHLLLPQTIWLIFFSVVVCLSISSQLNRVGSPYFQVSCWQSACSLREEFQEKDADFIFGIQIQNTATQSFGSSSSSNSTNVLRGYEDRLPPIPDPVFLYIENKQILQCCPPLIGCLVSSPQPHSSLCHQLQETIPSFGKSQMIPFLPVFACRYNFQ